MPRNASGVYTLAAGNPVDSGTLIEASWANNTLNDLASAMTDSLSRNGEGGMLAPFRLADGTLGAPGIAWTNEPSTGFYRSAAGTMWGVVGGAQILQYTSNGVLIPSTKTLTAQGNASVGGNLSVTGTLAITGGVTFTGNASVGGTLGVTGATTLSSTLGVTGAITATGGVVGNLTGNVTGNVSGNAGTVTNGVYTSGSYADPAWITSLAGSKVSGNISGNAANVTGTVAVANGGTGATTASAARTNLGLAIGTDVPSPTGTGASGTWGINISGNAATATSATSATTAGSATTATTATNVSGGTASVTTLTASSTVTLSAGTAQNIPYLNASKQIAYNANFVLDTNANLGVGTSAPKLRVQFSAASAQNAPTLGTAQGIAYLSNNDANYGLCIGNSATTGAAWFQAQRTDGTATAYDILLNPAGGNVGIGTSSPSYPLHVVKNASGAQKVYFSNNSTNSAAETAFSVSNGTAEGSLRVAGTSYSGYGAYTANNTLLYNDTSAITIMADNATNGIIKFASGSNSERARIDSSGNLLVGTSSITTGVSGTETTLALQGNSSGKAASFVAVNNAGTGSGFFGVGADNNSYLFAKTNNVLIFGTNNTERGRIRADGVLVFPTIYSNTTAAAANTYVASDGQMARSTSSLKYKRDVQDSPRGIADVLALRAVTYKGKAEGDGEKVFGGLIAEEVHEAGLTEFVQYAEDGSPDALAYGNMVSLAFKAIQEQQALIESLTARIAALESASGTV